MRFSLTRIVILLISIALGVSGLYLYRGLIFTGNEKASVLVSEKPAEIGLPARPNKTGSVEPVQLVSISVPFTSQAPSGNWDMPYQEACEEASILMAVRYARGEEIRSVSDAYAGILELAEKNVMKFGDSVDESIEDVRDLIEELDSDIPLKILDNPSIEDIKGELLLNNIIIVPVTGKVLKNPYFIGIPRYHMLIITGYTSDDFFITNEPGTTHGEGYQYSFGRIMDAMHDLTDGKIEDGDKRVLVVGSI